MADKRRAWVPALATYGWLVLTYLGAIAVQLPEFSLYSDAQVSAVEAIAPVTSMAILVLATLVWIVAVRRPTPVATRLQWGVFVLAVLHSVVVLVILATT